MHLADTDIQRNVQFIQAIYVLLVHGMHSVGIKPIALALLVLCLSD